MVYGFMLVDDPEMAYDNDEVGDVEVAAEDEEAMEERHDEEDVDADADADAEEDEEVWPNTFFCVFDDSPEKTWIPGFVPVFLRHFSQVLTKEPDIPSHFKTTGIGHTVGCN